MSTEFRFFFLLFDDLDKEISPPAFKKTQDLQRGGRFCFYDQLYQNQIISRNDTFITSYCMCQTKSVPCPLFSYYPYFHSICTAVFLRKGRCQHFCLINGDLSYYRASLTLLSLTKMGQGSSVDARSAIAGLNSSQVEVPEQSILTNHLTS